MSIGFLLGGPGSPRQRRTTCPQWRSQEYERREEPTLDERLRDRVEIWREVDPDFAQALERVMLDRTK